MRGRYDGRAGASRLERQEQCGGKRLPLIRAGHNLSATQPGSIEREEGSASRLLPSVQYNYAPALAEACRTRAPHHGRATAHKASLIFSGQFWAAPRLTLFTRAVLRVLPAQVGGRIAGNACERFMRLCFSASRRVLRARKADIPSRQARPGPPHRRPFLPPE